MSFKNELENSFGTADHIFGGHPIDSKNAREMLKEASAKGLSKNDIENEAREYLASKGCSSDHIDEQIKKVNDIESYL